MSVSKIPKQNIIANTSDIAPPQKRSGFVSVPTNNVQPIKSRQKRIVNNKIKVQNASEKLKSTTQLKKTEANGFVKNERPFLHEVNEIADNTETNLPDQSIDKRIVNSDLLNASKDAPAQINSQMELPNSAVNSNSASISPRVITFNHSQYLHDEELEKIDGDKIINNNSTTADGRLKTEEESLQRNKQIEPTNDYKTDINNLDQQVAGFFGDKKKTEKVTSDLQNKSNYKLLDKGQRHDKSLRKKKKIKSPVFSFALGATVVLLLVGGMSLFTLGYQTKNSIEVKGAQAVNYFKEAKINLEDKNFEQASTNLLDAKKEFISAQKELDRLGGNKLNILKHIPILSKVSSGKSVVDLGTYSTEAVYELSKISKLLDGLQNPLDLEKNNSTPLDLILLDVQKHIDVARISLKKAEESSRNIKPEDLPEKYAKKIRTVKELLPLINKNLDDTDRFAKIFLELFGHYGPRKYLIVFQNNQEMRATGGFIGSYGLLETNNGKIDNLKIEGIYNPDGQLKVDVVPPRPIQKISAGWSTHDANWWPDFPKSAQKISWFYEKTGGPTTDGVIAVTPTLLQKMLEITGPIEMPEYNKTITAQNFIKEVQKEVEEDYDKEENKPKKILADLTPKLFAKFFDLKNPKQIAQVIKVLLSALDQKQVLIYFTNNEIEKTVAQQGWAGKILETDKDYLMVVDTNINGYKTDGVIKEIVNHQAKIESDGSVVDTVSITRKHRGGNTDYEWWNKVNSDYMRIYVPRGSKLISVDGQTREFNEERLSYDKLGFQVDPDVAKEEKYMQIDSASGTRIYEENNKTVFANWVYVSPQEQATITYKYKLPFKVDVQKNNGSSYSLLAQKQSGAVNSEIIAEIEFPFRWEATWLHPKNMNFDKEYNKFIYRHNLDTDQFMGVVFKDK